jgi:hypothetical protein
MRFHGTSSTRFEGDHPRHVSVLDSKKSRFRFYVTSESRSDAISTYSLVKNLEGCTSLQTETRNNLATVTDCKDPCGVCPVAIKILRSIQD